MADKKASTFILKTVVFACLAMFLLASCNPVTTTENTPFSPTLQTTIQSTSVFNLNLPAAEPSATPTPAACLDLKGSILDQDIPSEVLEDPINVKIYLPPCYDPDSDTQYAVLYMLHGQTSLDDQWVSLGLLSKMDELLALGLVEPFIIVLPAETKSNIEGFNSEYGDAVVRDVIPYINDNFRACVERSCRAIGGLSRGGNWAVHLGFEYPTLFAAVGAHSTPLFYGEISNIYRIVTTQAAAESLPIFYIDVGDRDEDLADVLLFNDTLQELNIQHVFNNFLGYHDGAYWSAHVQDYLLWYDSQLSVPLSDQREIILD